MKEYFDHYYMEEHMKLCHFRNHYEVIFHFLLASEILSDHQWKSSWLLHFTNDIVITAIFVGWLRGPAVKRLSLTGELSLFCARPIADR